MPSARILKCHVNVEKDGGTYTISGHGASDLHGELTERGMEPSSMHGGAFTIDESAFREANQRIASQLNRACATAELY